MTCRSCGLGSPSFGAELGRPGNPVRDGPAATRSLVREQPTSCPAARSILRRMYGREAEAREAPLAAATSGRQAWCLSARSKGSGISATIARSGKEKVDDRCNEDGKTICVQGAPLCRNRRACCRGAGCRAPWLADLYDISVDAQWDGPCAGRKRGTTDVGQIVEVRTHDNQHVHTGDVLYVMEKFDFEVALDNAKATILNREADLAVKKAKNARRAALTTLSTSIKCSMVTRRWPKPPTPAPKQLFREPRSIFREPRYGLPSTAMSQTF